MLDYICTYHFKSFLLTFVFLLVRKIIVLRYDIRPKKKLGDIFEVCYPNPLLNYGRKGKNETFERMKLKSNI